jgi:DNA polymerase-4
VKKTGSRGRTITVKIKWADFRQATRSRTLASVVETRSALHEVALALIRSVFPPRKGIRLVGVSISNLAASDGEPVEDLLALAQSRREPERRETGGEAANILERSAG